MFEEKSFHTGELIINYAEGPPSGPPLILLHGLSGTWQSLLSMFPILSMRWHVYALDLRGHGKSGWAGGQYMLKDHARDVTAFIEQLLDEPPALYGHSLGGMVGIMVAARKQMQALIVGDSPLYQDTIFSMYPAEPGDINPVQELVRRERSMKKLVPALRELMPDMDPTFYRYYAKSCSQLDPEIFTPLRVIIEGYDCEELFPRISCPVLLLQVDHMTDGDVDRALSQLTDGSVICFRELSHHLQMDPRGYPVILTVAKFLETL